MKDYLLQGSDYSSIHPIVRCATCGDVIRRAAVIRDEQSFCCAWHADQYQPPAPWWKRAFKDRRTPRGPGRG